MTGVLSPSARLLRGFAISFLTAHDVTAVEWVMDPAYRLSIGGHVFSGRDDSYLPATAAQLEMFPGLVVTAHDVILGPDHVALRFTEHGVSVKNPGCAAAWGGVTLFRIENGRLAHGWAEEDYFARKRQLKSGICDAVQPPHPSPWDVPCEAPDRATQDVVQKWMEHPPHLFGGALVEDIIVDGPSFGALIRPEHIVINQMFTAGKRAAFHLDCHGSYAGGFADIDPRMIGTRIVLRMAGMVTVRHGQVSHAAISADRLGLHRHLLDKERAI